MKDDKSDKKPDKKPIRKPIKKPPQKTAEFGTKKATKTMKSNNCMCQKCKINYEPYIIVKPIVNRYFFICPEDINLFDSTYTLNAEQFVDDEGKSINIFRTYGSSGYTNLFINGVLQGSSFYQINSTTLQLNPTGETIIKGTTIIIEVIGFILVKQDAL